MEPRYYLLNITSENVSSKPDYQTIIYNIKMEKKKAFRQRRNSDSESDEERIENNEEEL